MSQDNLFVTLIKKSVGLPTGNSDCCGSPVGAQSNGCCGSGSSTGCCDTNASQGSAAGCCGDSGDCCGAETSEEKVESARVA